MVVRYVVVLISCLLCVAPAFAGGDGEDPCRAECRAEADAFFKNCVAEGGEDCEGRAAETYEQCVLEYCAGDPPPEEPTCRQLCEQHAKEIFHGCLEDGLTEEECHARKLAAYEECVQANCGEEPPEEPTCEKLCEKHGQEVYAACREEGGGPEVCKQRMREAIEACIERECQNEPPHEPTCEERCEKHADEVEARCLEDGGGPEVCATKRRQALERCIASECGEEPPEEPTCREQCLQEAKQLFHACLEEGLTEEECAARKLAAYEECVQANCGEEPPEEPTCKEICKRRADGVLHECLEAGGTEKACWEQRELALRECIQSECEGEEPPPEEPPPCKIECTEQAEVFFAECTASGGSEKDCRRQTDAMLTLCLVRCGSEQPCENRCAVAAQIVLTGCSIAGLPEDECVRLANVVLEGCLAECTPPSQCGAGCEDLAGLAVAECLERGGTEEECGALGRQVVALCTSHCNGEPVPSCDVQCEDMADSLAESCAAEGLSPAVCDQLRSQFLEACLLHHSENCTEEARVDTTLFQPFKRGDANQDSRIDIADPVSVLEYLFAGRPGGSCQDAADANDDGSLDIADPIAILMYLFATPGQGIPEPISRPGQDPTSDTLVCAP
jgi:hypothetical protein